MMKTDLAGVVLGVEDTLGKTALAGEDFLVASLRLLKETNCTLHITNSDGAHTAQKASLPVNNRCKKIY